MTPEVKRLVEALRALHNEHVRSRDAMQKQWDDAIGAMWAVEAVTEGEPKADRCAGCKFDHRHCQLCLDDIEAQKAPPEGEQAGVERNEPTWGDFEMAAKRTYLALRKSAEWKRRAEKAERKLKSIRMHSTGMKRLLDGGELVQDEADAWRKVLEWLAEIEAKQE